MTKLSNHSKLTIRRGPDGHGAVLLSDCRVANSFLGRLKGLLGRTSLEEHEGLILVDTNDIHMWGMRFPIDAVFLRRTSPSEQGVWEVSSVRENLRPWRALPVRDARAQDTLEVMSGSIARWKLKEGDRLCIA